MRVTDEVTRPAPLRVAIAGVGNCASSLVQGCRKYADLDAQHERPALITPRVGGFGPGDLQFVAAFDVDARKVGRPLSEAIFAPPNNTMRFSEPPEATRDVGVAMAPPLDGIAPHMAEYPEAAAFRMSDAPPVDVAEQLRAAAAEILVCYLPVGSTNAVRLFAEAALAAGVAFVNCVPVFIANDPELALRFRNANLPIIGDDIRSQLGATIVHQRLVELFAERGCTIRSTYQLNVGGNTDFLNMLDRSRLNDKKSSKTRAVQRQNAADLLDANTHIGPSDYVPSQADGKIAFIRIDGSGFGCAPMSVDLRLEVEDSPNSAGVALDAIRYAGVALRARVGGVLNAASSYYMKSPPEPMSDIGALAILREQTG